MRFSLVVFNIIQKRKILTQSTLVAKQSEAAAILAKIKEVNFAKVREKLAAMARFGPSRKMDFQDSALNLIVSRVKNVAKHVCGSSDNMLYNRQRMSSTFIFRGAPAVWITLNPLDNMHPLFRKIAGITPPEKLDPAMLKRWQTRATQVDPVSQARFYQRIIDGVIGNLLGGGTRTGYLGDLISYYINTETQDKGTLHAHILLWLQGVPNPSEIRESLETNDYYRKQVLSFVETFQQEDFSICRAPTVEEIHGTAASIGPASQHFPYEALRKDIDQETPKELLEIDAKSISSIHNVHRHSGTCYKKCAQGEKICRFGFLREGRPLVSRTHYDESIHQIKIKREDGFTNNWCPGLSNICRSNLDFKFMFTSGLLSQSSYFYISNYSIKSDDIEGDDEALRKAYQDLERQNILPDPDTRETLRRLLIRINYIRSNTLQFPAALVAHILLSKDVDPICCSSDTVVLLYYGSMASYISSSDPRS